MTNSIVQRNTPLRVEVIESLEQSLELLPWWTARAATPLQSPEWLLSWWEAYQAPGSSLYILTVLNGSDILGIMPLWRSRSVSVVRTLQWLGSGRACTDFQSVIAKPEHHADACRGLADWLLKGDGGSTWDLIELDGLANPEALEPMLQPMRDAGAAMEQVTHEHTWRLNLADGFAGFMAGLSRTQRAQARNLLNRFDKHKGLTFRVVEGELATQALGNLIDLHQRRWAASGGEGCFADPRFENFLRNAVERMALRNRIELAVLEDSGRTIGTLLSLRDAHGNLYAYQTGRDPAYEHARVGQMLTFLVVRDACERSVGFIDYLRGDETYKQRLAAQPTPCKRMRLFAPTFISQIPYHALHISKIARDGVASIHDAGKSAIMRLIRSFES